MGASCRSTDAEATSTADRSSGPSAASRASNASRRAAPPTGTGSIDARPRRWSSLSSPGSSRSAKGLPPAISIRDPMTFDGASGALASSSVRASSGSRPESESAFEAALPEQGPLGTARARRDQQRHVGALEAP